MARPDQIPPPSGTKPVRRCPPLRPPPPPATRRRNHRSPTAINRSPADARARSAAGGNPPAATRRLPSRHRRRRLSAPTSPCTDQPPRVEAKAPDPPPKPASLPRVLPPAPRVSLGRAASQPRPRIIPVPLRRAAPRRKPPASASCRSVLRRPRRQRKWRRRSRSSWRRK